jgi:hypothetical protein
MYPTEKVFNFDDCFEEDNALHNASNFRKFNYILEVCNRFDFCIFLWYVLATEK